MRSVTLIVLLAFIVRANANQLETIHVDEAHNSMDHLVDKLVEKLVEKGTLTTQNKGPLKSLGSFLLSRLPGFHKQEAKTGGCCSPKEDKVLDCCSKDTQVKDVESASPKAKTVGHLAVAKAIFNLVKNIVGAGVLSLPAAVGAIGGNRDLLFPALSLVVTMALLSAYTFFSVGRQCGIHGVSTYNNAWARSAGKRAEWIGTIIAAVYPLFACLSYSIIIGDSFSALAKGGILGPQLEKSPISLDRRTWILSLTAAVLYPLCSLRKLGGLAVTSLLGTLAVAYTGVFMMIRYFDGSYLPGGTFDAVLSTEHAVKPQVFPGSYDHFASAFKDFVTRSGTFFLMAMLGSAFNAHPNAPSYYNEIGRDDKTFGLVVGLGFGLSILFNLVFLVSGFLTFGQTSQGLILNSYAAKDKLAAVARALFGISIVFTYPVVFNGFKPVARDLLLRLTKFKDGALLNQALTAIPLILITVVSVIVSNVGIVNAIRGAICGSALIYVMPSFMNVVGKGALRHPVVKGLNIALLVFGVLMAVLGLYASLALTPATPTVMTTTAKPAMALMANATKSF